MVRPMKKVYLIKLVQFFVLIVIASGVFAMSLNDFGRVCLFSKMSGVITLNGKPAAGAKLVRTANRDGVKTDETITDANGHFEFPAMFERTAAKYLPQEFVASQIIMAHYEGKEYEMWNGVKRKPEENSESRGKPLIVECELTNERKLITVNRNPIFTICKWDVEPDPKKAIF